MFLGSGLLFLGMLFMAAVTSVSMLEMVASVNADADLWAFGRDSTETLISVYAMRMAAVFTLSVEHHGVDGAGECVGRLGLVGAVDDEDVSTPDVHAGARPMSMPE